MTSDFPSRNMLNENLNYNFGGWDQGHVLNGKANVDAER